MSSWLGSNTSQAMVLIFEDTVSVKGIITRYISKPARDLFVTNADLLSLLFYRPACLISVMRGPNPALHGKQRTTRDDQTLMILAKQMQNYFYYRVVRSKTKDLTILIPILVFFLGRRIQSEDAKRLIHPILHHARCSSGESEM